MLSTCVGKPTKFKKTIYLLAFSTLGVLLSVIVYAVIEIFFLIWFREVSLSLPVFNVLLLLKFALLALGVISGYSIGSFCWQKLYVERVWLRKGKKCCNKKAPR
ncbi:MAG: hypothetical protein NT165_01410 [Candidatus Falkowbacteria bacterium]|nr:hypothetical protein [Candidatus Falkowbacteria bacterium]